MVKFQERKLRRRYKNKQATYTRFLLEFPSRLNNKLTPHQHKIFDEMNVTLEETETQEKLNISLVRKKPKQ